MKGHSTSQWRWAGAVLLAAFGLVACGDTKPATNFDAITADASIVDVSIVDVSIVDASEPDASALDASAPDAINCPDRADGGSNASGDVSGPCGPYQAPLGAWYCDGASYACNFRLQVVLGRCYFVCIDGDIQHSCLPPADFCPSATSITCTDPLLGGTLNCTR